ncbi:MAG: DUF3592 domain-containing protein [Planctomycetaceae bacterium]|nr:DUF3592 domain-containing protein [Planctomycetaceae bacterium]
MLKVDVVVWLISALLFIGGIGLAVVFWIQTSRPGLPIPPGYRKTRCIVVEKDVLDVKIEEEKPRHIFMPSVQFRYSVNGEEFEIWNTYGGGFKDRAEAETEVADFVVGEEYPCWYDPKKPNNTVIQESNRDVIAAGMVGLVGLVGLVYCSVRSLLARRKSG